ncbi:TIGR03089 family protein [Xylanimonas allomyrinae]|uniref:TIGR03089 family protein n=2 Tax=Xylanimonas allomyrinae TaxID=2509459 RepID=A0A4P6EPG5_9MICO|nr:TIGR03089 family protein [Xylanimonas allomyrinae]
MNVLVSDPGRPRLTWYGDDGERVELSGAVLANWVNKTTNLLVEEFDAGAGRRILIDLVPHWRSAVWVLGALRCGATAVLAGPGGRTPDGHDPDVTITTRPAAHTGDVVAVALPALARRFDGDLPPGTIDAASAVMTYADTVGWAPATDPGEPAIVAPAATAPVQGVLFGDLFGWASGAEPRGRVLLDGRAPLVETLRSMLGAWSAGGSVVLTSAATATALAGDPARLTRLVAQEGVTVTPSGR